MPPVGFEPTIAVLERAKTVLSLDRAATAIGYSGRRTEKLIIGILLNGNYTPKQKRRP
jgi:hypothetical protein